MTEVAASLRWRLLAGILLPVTLVLVVNTVSTYRQARTAIDTAYDRSLLASAKAIGELLEVEAGPDGRLRLRASVPYAALEAFEADNRSRLYYKVTDFDGSTVTGYADLERSTRPIPAQGPYAALVTFYDSRFLDEAVRMAQLLQPVAGPAGRGMATIHVAETLELRRALTRQLLLTTLIEQAAVLGVIVVVVLVVVQHTTRLVHRLGRALDERPAEDLRALDTSSTPAELLPLVSATNRFMARLDHLLEHQKRFVRDASHQLRTPLAVLKVQVQSALRGDQPADAALRDIGTTVDRATTLANQMLALAKVEQLRQQGDTQVQALDDIVRGLALDLAPLMAERDLDFGLATEPVAVESHAWMLRELARNLLHNAIRHSPRGGRLELQVRRLDERRAELVISDDGPGLPAEVELRLFQPFAAGDPRSGSGLGLAICQEIVHSLGGRIRLERRAAGHDPERPAGLDARVELPVARPSTPDPAPPGRAVHTAPS